MVKGVKALFARFSVTGVYKQCSLPKLEGRTDLSPHYDYTRGYYANSSTVTHLVARQVVRWILGVDKVRVLHRPQGNCVPLREGHCAWASPSFEVAQAQACMGAVF